MAKKQFWKHVKPYLKDLFLKKILKANLSAQVTKLLLILKGHKSSSGPCSPSQSLLSEEMTQCSTLSKRTHSERNHSYTAYWQDDYNKYLIKIDDELEEFKQQSKESQEVETKIKNECNYYKNGYKNNSYKKWTIGNFKVRSLNAII